MLAVEGWNNEHAADPWWMRLTVSMENETADLLCLNEESLRKVAAVVVD